MSSEAGVLESLQKLGHKYAIANRSFSTGMKMNMKMKIEDEDADEDRRWGM